MGIKKITILMNLHDDDEVIMTDENNDVIYHIDDDRWHQLDRYKDFAGGMSMYEDIHIKITAGYHDAFPTQNSHHLWTPEAIERYIQNETEEYILRKGVVMNENQR